MQCQEAGPPSNEKQSYSIMIRGTGILPNSSACYVHAEGFKLLPHSLGRTTVTLNKAHIVLANIDNLLNLKEEQSSYSRKQINQ
jgi:hypothetical protein